MLIKYIFIQDNCLKVFNLQEKTVDQNILGAFEKIL